MTDQPTRAGFIALLGAPNAGKSTLMNALIGSKVAIVTPKAQTTRSHIRGICVEGNSQLIFVDTPGVFDAKKRFEKAMVSAAWTGVRDADVVMLLIDASRPTGDNHAHIIEQLKVTKQPAILVLNKVDAVDKTVLLELANSLAQQFFFEQIFMISALRQDGVKDIASYLAYRVPEGPWLYEKDALTDSTERQLAAETTREKLFMALGDELPYSLYIETEAWEEKPDGSVKINQVILVERESQKKIIIGKGGEKLKSISMSARRDIERVLGRKAHLFLFVKVKEDWKERPDAYRDMGLEF